MSEQNEWLPENRAAVDGKIQQGIAELDRGEGIPEDELDAYLDGLESPAGVKRYILAPAAVRDLAVYSYLIVYRPDTKPLQVAAVLHGARDVAKPLLTRPH